MNVLVRLATIVTALFRGVPACLHYGAFIQRIEDTHRERYKKAMTI